MPDQSIIPMTNSKGFLPRPEDKIGLLGTAAAVIAVVWFFGSFIMDYIIHALENGIHLLIVTVAFLGLLFMIFDPKLRAAFYYIYRSFWRMVTSWFINNDPIGWMKTYKERLEEKLTLMDNNISNLTGQKVKIGDDVDHNNQAIQRCMLLAAQAEKRADKSNELLQTRQADRLNTENNEMTKDLTKIIFLLDVLNKARGVADFNIKDVGMEIASQTRRRNYSRSAKGTIQAALGIIKGIPVEKDLYDESLEAAKNQYAANMGEVDHFLEITKDAMGAADLNDAADQERAMQMLKDWQAKNALGDNSLRLTLPPAKEPIPIAVKG